MTTGYLAENDAIETEFRSTWDEAATPIAFDNVQFTTEQTQEWVRLVDLHAGARQASLGDNPLYRYRGMVVVQVFTLSGTGRKRALEIVDLVTPIFRSKRVGSIQFEVPEAIRIGDRDGWYQMNVNCPYYREE